MSEHKIPIPSMIYNAAVGGHVTNSQQIIDENLNREQNDINQETVGAVPYNSTTPNGMGRIVLKKNDNFKQVVEAQTDGNTIFVIKYDFILTGNITIPSNCILQFEGGSINGAYTITGNNTIIKAEAIKIFNTDIIIDGTWQINIAYPEWFGAKANGIDDDSPAFAKLNSIITPDEPYGFVPKFSRTIYLSRKTYVLKQLVMLYCNLIGAEGSIVKMDGGNFQTRYGRGLYHRYKIEGIEFTATSNSDVIFDNENDFLSVNKCVFHDCENVFVEKNVPTNWIGCMTISDCLFYEISGSVFKSNGDLNGLNAVGNRFYRCNSILQVSRLHAILFTCSSVENSRIYKNIGNSSGLLCNGVSFNGCYIEGSYAQDTDNNDAIIHINGNAVINGEISFNNCYITFEKYFLYNNCTLSSYEWSMERSILRFKDCCLFRYEDNFELFHYEDNYHLPTIYIEGARRAIGKFNTQYQTIDTIKNISDTTNKPENVKYEVDAYDFYHSRYIKHTNLIPACPTTERTNSMVTLDLNPGFWYFDTTLGKPIYWTGDTTKGDNGWVDANGNNPSQS